MPRKASRTATEAELRILEVLWDKSVATVREVTDSLTKPALNYGTVLTMLRILERKGHVAHEQRGRVFYYKPLLTRDDAAMVAIGETLSRYFRESPTALAVKLLAQHKPSQEELEKIKTVIAQYEESVDGERE
jgi:predicted transcriptional regulator